MFRTMGGAVFVAMHKKEAPLAAAIVRATKTHALDTIWEGEEYTAFMRQACEWVLDADIAILGSNERDLEVYDDGIAKEWGYGKKNPEYDAAFAKKRVQVLRAMQTKPFIDPRNFPILSNRPY